MAGASPCGGRRGRGHPPRAGQGRVLAAVLAGVLCGLGPGESPAGCRVVRGTDEPPNVLSLRLSGDCTERDRQTEAVMAAEVLQALREGRDVDLVNVLVTGDLLLDDLPPMPRDRLGQYLPDWRDVLGEDRGGPVRATSGRLSIRDSDVQGRVAANLTGGHLIMGGPVTLAGTTFRRYVDLTRTVFVSPVAVSRARFDGEALFVRARFLEAARFDNVSFGPRARFHRSRFVGPAVFAGATFNGMAEFLEVTFAREADFAGARFRLGAGFSGSRFEGRLDLSDALFQRGAFFLYTRYGADASFRGATFRGLADFSHAEFHGAGDFAMAFFEREPRFPRTTSTGMRSPTPGGQDPRLLYAVAAVLAVLTLLLLRTRRRG